MMACLLAIGQHRVILENMTLTPTAVMSTSQPTTSQVPLEATKSAADRISYYNKRFLIELNNA